MAQSGNATEPYPGCTVSAATRLPAEEKASPALRASAIEPPPEPSTRGPQLSTGTYRMVLGCL